MLLGVIKTDPIYIHDFDLSAEDLENFLSSTDEQKQIFLEEYTSEMKPIVNVILDDGCEHNYKYKSNEFYFGVYINPSYKDDVSIYLTLSAEYELFKQQTDNLRYHNLIEEDAILAGIGIDLAESVFEYDYKGESKQEIIDRIQKAGFIYSEKFDLDINGNYNFD